MNDMPASVIAMLNPAVPKKYLFGLAGVLWTLAGLVLCVRAIVWLSAFSLGVELALETTSFVIGALGYVFLFVRIVQKNIDRIRQLPDRACVFAFSAWRGYVMIGLMMAIGITLRNTSIPKYFLAVPYTAMGAILLIGSARFFGLFINSFIRRA
jgi:hypothetical protein